MVNASNLPIQEITQKNFIEQWKSILTAIDSSTFIAIDLEMSGLGDRKNLTLQSIEERYKTCCELAMKYSVVSIGISCFNLEAQNLEQKEIKFTNKTFNILTLCSEEFMVEPGSLKFLLNHGFDFNKQFSEGLKFHRGNDKENNGRADHSIRDLILKISHSKKPIILHNGFIDLIFLYQNFYAKCPESSLKFLADMEEIFSGGIYDTKFIADFHAHSPASFLEYLYKKALYENSQNKSGTANKYTEVEFLFNSSILDDFKIELKSVDQEEIPLEKSICNTYAVYGYCKKIETCPKSHDINSIIQTELNAEQRKKKNKKLAKYSIIEKSNEPSEKIENKPHSAGLDAFMTGYIMLNYINRFSKFKITDNLDHEKPELSHFDFCETRFKNNIALAGKDYPLSICKSNFATISIRHKEKKEKYFLKN